MHYVDMAHSIQKMTKDTKNFDDLPEFIRNLANLVFTMNDSKGAARPPNAITNKKMTTTSYR